MKKKIAKFARTHQYLTLVFNKLKAGGTISNCSYTCISLLRYLKQSPNFYLAFLWILQNFQEHLFYRTPLDDCFYLYSKLSWYMDVLPQFRAEAGTFEIPGWNTQVLLIYHRFYLLFGLYQCREKICLIFFTL